MFNDYEGEVTHDKKSLPFYSVWRGMFYRCTSEAFHKKEPTYRGCTVCEEWQSLTTFKVWFDQHYRPGFQLDKDLLVEGNKEYSPKTCRFVPSQLNSLFSLRGNARGNLPLGVREKRGMNLNKPYEARVNIRGVRKFLGHFSTPEDAHEAYIIAKRMHIVSELKSYEGIIEEDLRLVLLERWT